MKHTAKRRKKVPKKEQWGILFMTSLFIIFGVLTHIFSRKNAVSATGTSPQSGHAVQLQKDKRTTEPPKNAVMVDVPYLSQDGILPTGCESVSAVMLLRFHGYSTTPADFVEKYLPQQELKWIDGQLFGPDPAVSFAGDPTTGDGYGCFAPVITKALNQVFSSTQKAVAAFGTPLMQLVKENLDRSQPVLIWASIEMRPTGPGTQWKIYGTNSVFTWIRNEHCLVLVGYDQERYYFNDPYKGNGVVSYKKALVEQRYQELGMQAVVIQQQT